MARTSINRALVDDQNFRTIMFTRRSESGSSPGEKLRDEKVAWGRKNKKKSFQLIIHKFIIKTLSSVAAVGSGYLLGMLETKGTSVPAVLHRNAIQLHRHAVENRFSKLYISSLSFSLSLFMIIWIYIISRNNANVQILWGKNFSSRIFLFFSRVENWQMIARWDIHVTFPLEII